MAVQLVLDEQRSEGQTSFDGQIVVASPAAACESGRPVASGHPPTLAGGHAAPQKTSHDPTLGAVRSRAVDRCGRRTAQSRMVVRHAPGRIEPSSSKRSGSPRHCERSGHPSAPGWRSRPPQPTWRPERSVRTNPARCAPLTLLTRRTPVAVSPGRGSTARRPQPVNILTVRFPTPPPLVASSRPRKLRCSAASRFA